MKHKENSNIKRYLKFAAVMAFSGLIGAICGISAFKSYGRFQQYMEAIPQWLVQYNGIIIAVICAVVIVVGLAVRAKGKTLLANHEEDELIDEKISKLVMISMSTTVVAMGLLLAIYGSVASTAISNGDIQSLIIVVAGFMIGWALTFASEITTINFVKKVNPSRNGDPLSMKFNKDWMNSCDEAEKQIVFMASFKTFTFMKHFILGLFVIMLLLGLTMEVDFMVYLLLGIMFIANNLVYIIYTNRIKSLNNI